MMRYTRHVRRFPCEHIHVVSQKPDEHAFLFVREVVPDAGDLGWVPGNELDLLHLLVLGVLSWSHLRGDLVVNVGNPLGLQLYLCRSNGEVDCLGQLETFFLAGMCDGMLARRERTPLGVGILSTK